MESKTKKIFVVNIIFIFGIIAVYFLDLNKLMITLAILSASIQIGMFIYWVFEESREKEILKEVIESNRNLDETRQIVQCIKEYQNKKEDLLEKRQRILINLIKEGTVPSKEINKIIKSIKNHGMFVVSTLGGNNFQLKRILKSTNESQISIIPKILIDLKFKRVYFNESLFIILKEDLPPKLRNSEVLREIIQSELTNKWNLLQKRVLDSGLSGYEKWKDGTGFFCNLCIINIEEGEIGILYQRLKETSKFKDTFSDEFKTLLMSHSNKRQIGSLISDKIKAKEIVNKISIGITFLNLPEQVKEILIPKEKEISQKLNLHKFLDLSNLKESEIKKVLSEYLSNSNLNSSTKIIFEEVQDYLKIIRELKLF